MQHKFIPSFGRRKVRKLKPTPQRTYQECFPLLEIDLEKDMLEASFPNVWLEVGFGGGEHMVEQLARHPAIGMIGCEPFLNGVAKLLTHMSPEDYKRVRVWQGDVRYLLEATPSFYFSRIFILFPDPWPKKRHHHRRLITKEFMAKLHPTFKEGGFLYVASDDISYVEQIQGILYTDPCLTRIHGPLSADPLTWTERPEGWPSTRYEQKALAQNKKCAYMVFQKKELSS